MTRRQAVAAMVVALLVLLFGGAVVLGVVLMTALAGAVAAVKVRDWWADPGRRLDREQLAAHPDWPFSPPTSTGGQP